MAKQADVDRLQAELDALAPIADEVAKLRQREADLLHVVHLQLEADRHRSEATKHLCDAQTCMSEAIRSLVGIPDDLLR